MNQAANMEFRIIAREVAQELTVAEVEEVSGGKCVVKATWSQKNGADAEISCEF